MHVFSGLYKSRKIITPKGEKTRPTSGRLRETLFNICQGRIEGAAFLDLFAGSGAMGLEALSRGADHITFVDNSRESIRCIKANLESFGITKSGDVIYSDVFEAMKKLAKSCRLFDVIYADPPYDTFIQGTHEKKTLSTHVLSVLDELMELKLPLLKTGGSVFLEDAPESLPEGKVFKHFILKDKRNMGRSAFQRWDLKKEGE